MAGMSVCMVTLALLDFCKEKQRRSRRKHAMLLHPQRIMSTKLNAIADARRGGNVYSSSLKVGVAMQKIDIRLRPRGCKTLWAIPHLVPAVIKWVT